MKGGRTHITEKVERFKQNPYPEQRWEIQTREVTKESAWPSSTAEISRRRSSWEKRSGSRSAAASGHHEVYPGWRSRSASRQLPLYSGPHPWVHHLARAPQPQWWCISFQGLPGGASGKESAWPRGRPKRHGFHPWVGKIPWRSAWQPLQYACLENPMHRGVWQATAHGFQRVRHD